MKYTPKEKELVICILVYLHLKWLGALQKCNQCEDNLFWVHNLNFLIFMWFTCHLNYFQYHIEIKSIAYFFTTLEIFLLGAKVLSLYFVSSSDFLKLQPLFYDYLSPKARSEDSTTWYAADSKSIFCVCARQTSWIIINRALLRAGTLKDHPFVSEELLESSLSQSASEERRQKGGEEGWKI